jgi:hypothetical protein
MGNIKKILEVVAGVTVIIISVLFLGLLTPVIVSVFIVITTEATFSQCVATAPFWVVSIVGIIASSIAISEY